jgi:hypothetical protein
LVAVVRGNTWAEGRYTEGKRIAVEDKGIGLVDKYREGMAAVVDS